LRVLYTLNRATGVTFSLQRSLGRGRYTALRRLTSADANAGENAVTLTGRQLGRRAGLYRVSATVAGGATQVAQFRIRGTR
jgi:hypothetical protein